MKTLNGQSILLVGGTGFVGRSLGLVLAKAGAEIRVLTRHSDRAQLDLPFPARFLAWDGRNVPREALEGVAAVINVAGESLVAGRWTKKKWQAIVDSRVGITKALAAAAKAAAAWPKVLLQASAVGIYGTRAEEVLGEETTVGTDRVAGLCVAWEEATAEFTKAGTRVAINRFGVVLGLGGGALGQLAESHRFGVGAVIGERDAWLSWIHIDDLTRLLVAELVDERYAGVINAVAPEPCRWRAFSQGLLGGKGPVLGLPKALARMILGDGPVAVSTSTRVVPAKAEKLGFSFAFPSIDQALSDLLGQGARRTAGYLFAQQFVAAPLDKVAAFFSDERNLQELTPPWVDFHVVGKSTATLEVDTLINYRLKVKNVPLGWTSRITVWDLPRRFVDEQVRGPYASWSHEHGFEALCGGTLMTDLVRYRVPLGKIGQAGAGWQINKDVAKIFAYRRGAIAHRFAGQDKRTLTKSEMDRS